VRESKQQQYEAHVVVALRSAGLSKGFDTERLLSVRHASELDDIVRKRKSYCLANGCEKTAASFSAWRREHVDVGLDRQDAATGETVLHRTIRRWGDARSAEARARLEKSMAAMCVAGAPLEVCDAHDETPFLVALRRDCTPGLRILVAVGANYHRKNRLEYHPLLVAAEERRALTFRLLAETLDDREASLDRYAAYKGGGYTALHFGAINADAALLRVALGFEAYQAPSVINCVSSTETTASHRCPDDDASRVRHQTALHKAVYYGHADCVELLLAHGADPNARSESAHPPRSPSMISSPLHRHSWSPPTGGPIGGGGGDETPASPETEFDPLPLVSAARIDRADIARVLLAYGADPRAIADATRRFRIGPECGNGIATKAGA